MAFIEKKKLLNVKYKRRADSYRLLDKQFSINERDRFKVSIKGNHFVFRKTANPEIFQIVDEKGTKHEISFGGKKQLAHKDGTNIYFELHEDFLLSLDYRFRVYVGVSILLHLLLGGFLPFVMPESQEKIAQQKEQESEKRVTDLLKKIAKKQQPKPTPTQAPKKVVQKPKPTPPPPPPKAKPTPPPPKKIVRQKPKKRNRLRQPTTPRKGPRRQKRVHVTKNRTPPKRLVVRKGPPMRGGTGPQNPNARGNSAARSRAKKIARTKAKLASSLGFLAKGKGVLNIPKGVKGGSSRFIGGGAGLAGKANVKGKNFLAKISNSNAIGSSSGAINTRGSRTIASGRVVSDGEINGIAGGKSLNYVQGKVTVKGLYAAGGSGSFGSGGSGGSLTVQGGKISKDLIRRMIQKYMSQLRYCYEKTLMRKPSSQGLLKARWTIVPGGAVRGVGIVKSDINDATLHNCLGSVIAKIRFAPGPRGGPATVSYPFKFSPDQI